MDANNKSWIQLSSATTRPENAEHLTKLKQLAALLGNNERVE